MKAATPGPGEEVRTAGRGATSVRVVFYAGAASLAGCREVFLAWDWLTAEETGGGPAGRPDRTAGVPADRLRRRLRRRFPRLGRLLDACQLAVNGCLVREEEIRLRPGDEVAVLPPASGGSGEEADPAEAGAEATRPAGITGAAAGRVRVTEEPLSVDEALRLVADRDAGAVVLFLGTVRGRTGPRITESLFYEAHGPLALAGLEAIVAEAETRWPGTRLAVAHRLGLLRPGEVGVVVAAAAPHRDEAFAACRYAIEELKGRVPIWKEERGPGGSFWVHGDDPGGGGEAGSLAHAG